MTFELPKRTHLVHKPIEPRNLSKALQAGLDTSTKDWLWQMKYDGCHLIVVVSEGKGYGFSREGNPVPSCQHIADKLASLPPRCAVYFGEAYHHDWTFAKISGAYRRRSLQPELRFMPFDMVPLSDFLAGECQIDYATRLWWLADAMAEGDAYAADSPIWPVLHYPGCNLQFLHDLVSSVRQEHVLGLDGFVAKRADGHWLAGAGKGGEQIKVKDHISVDLRVLRLVEGQGKFAGMLGSLVCDYKGQELLVSGGTMTTEDRRMYWAARNRGRGDGSLFGAHRLVGRIVEVHGLATSEHGLIREPRFHRVRRDKTEPSV